MVHLLPECQLIPEFKVVHFAPESLVHFAPELLVHFTPELLVQFGPDYTCFIELVYENIHI